MSSQVDTLDLLRQHPRSTVAELANIVAPDRYHSTMVRVKQDILNNLIRLRKKGDVVRTEGEKPFRWEVVQ